MRWIYLDCRGCGPFLRMRRLQCYQAVESTKQEMAKQLHEGRAEDVWVGIWILDLEFPALARTRLAAIPI